MKYDRYLQRLYIYAYRKNPFLENPYLIGPRMEVVLFATQIPPDFVEKHKNSSFWDILDAYREEHPEIDKKFRGKPVPESELVDYLTPYFEKHPEVHKKLLGIKAHFENEI